MTPSLFMTSLIFLGIGALVSMILKRKINQYNKIPLSRGLTGKEVAEKMLRENNIYDVKVVSVNGFLSDHYNPITKVVNLSPDVYNGNSISAAAVAAHECGHAVQHADSYRWLNFRTGLVPAVQFTSGITQWILFLGVIMVNRFPGLLLTGVILFAATTLFSLVTLPVEFNASKRALAWLQHTNVTNAEEYPKAKEALKWAAMTYVVAALASVAILLQYLLILMGNRNRN